MQKPNHMKVEDAEKTYCKHSTLENGRDSGKREKRMEERGSVGERRKETNTHVFLLMH